jgi:hypothetical protein
MPDYLTPKIAFLSAVYFIIALVLILIVDIGLYWFLQNVVFWILDWFNGLNLGFKLLIIFVGVASLFWTLLSAVGTITTLLGGLIFNKLPQNLFTSISSFVLAIANAIWNIIILWKIPEHYNFWVVVELILLSVFIWSLSAIVLPAREQLNE